MFLKFFLFSLGVTLAASSIAGTSLHSATNDFVENPFVAVGVNPATHVVTGYFSARRTAPGGTDACKFLFRGRVGQDGKVRLTIRDALTGQQSAPAQGQQNPATLTIAKSSVRIELPETLAPGDCDWILEWVGGPHITKEKRGFTLSVDTGPQDDWIGVAAIRSKRAYFHDAPDAASVRKAFLVAGNIAYVTEEKPGWYHVRFTHAARVTTGWIRKSDTVQF